MIPVREQTTASRDIANLDRLCILFKARTKLREAMTLIDETETMIKSSGSYNIGKIVDLHTSRRDILIQWQEIENEIEMLF